MTDNRPHAFRRRQLEMVIEELQGAAQDAAILLAQTDRALAVLLVDLANDYGREARLDLDPHQLFAAELEAALKSPPAPKGSFVAMVEAPRPSLLDKVTAALEVIDQLAAAKAARQPLSEEPRPVGRVLCRPASPLEALDEDPMPIEVAEP